MVAAARIGDAHVDRVDLLGLAETDFLAAGAHDWT